LTQVNFFPVEEVLFMGRKFPCQSRSEEHRPRATRALQSHRRHRM